eukprot:GFUD01085180.1.p1 GENE.GFUD01085180.1~~GFUD01085180.1.p1  ORF type:complete len:487 (-),score=116.41 GFUD01085180.1:160-1620(-)
MAAIGSLLMNKVLGHSEAEKAFRPWWDTLEDFLIYSLVLLGIITVPTAIITGTPLDCSLCHEDHCQANGEVFFNNKTVPGFNLWWVKKYCTMNGSVDPFMLYFPYFLLLIALGLVFIERVFSRAFHAGTKLEKFYSLLCRENVLGEVKAVVTDGGAAVCQTSNSDGGREAIELRQSFNHSNNYFISYLMRTVLETIFAFLLLIYICADGLSILTHADTIICDVHGYFYECSGQPAQFYVYILYITIIITCMYILCNIYNLVWILLPQFGKLSRLMISYKQSMRAREGNSKTDKELLGDLYDIYYNNRDLRLLLDLLATSSGVAPAISVMTLFDKGFREAIRPKIKHIVASRELGIAEVKFQEPKSGVRACLASLPGVHLMYVAEIIPPAASAVEAFESKYVEEGKDNIGLTGLDVEKSAMEFSMLKGHIQRACFEGLKKGIDYSVKVSTVVNGKTISEVCEDIEEEHEVMPEETAETEDITENVDK